jgi:predicted nuclease of predicted toxin-antitoxin system
VRLWLDAQLSPALCDWLSAEFGLQATAIRDLGLLEAEDQKIFLSARQNADAVVTKDRDFVELVHRLGPPPKVIWITAGNTSNQSLKRILSETLSDALDMLEKGEVLVEIQSPS